MKRFFCHNIYPTKKKHQKTNEALFPAKSQIKINDQFPAKNRPFPVRFHIPSEGPIGQKGLFGFSPNKKRWGGNNVINEGIGH